HGRQTRPRTPRPPRAGRNRRTHPQDHLRRLLDALVPRSQHQGDQRTPPRSEFRIRSGRIRSPYARVLRLRVVTMAIAYLAQFGRLAFVGRFEPAVDAVGAFARGDRVVIRGPRGLELATVMCEAIERFHRDSAEGELLRPASFDDFAAAERNEALGQRLLAAAEATDLPISFIDSEVSLDGTAAVLHGLPWGDCDASPLFASLSERFGLAVRLLD